MQIAHMGAKVAINGTFTAEEVVQLITAWLVGRSYFTSEDRVRVFVGTVEVSVTERIVPAEESASSD